MNNKKEFSVRPFEKLRRTMERNAIAEAPPAPRRKKKEEYTDEELFSREMDDVHEIELFRALNCVRHHDKTSSLPARRNPDAEALTILGEIVEGTQPISLPDTQEYVEWTNPEYHDAIIPKLHGGHFSVQAFLDLHGCTVPEAEAEFEDFLRDAFKKDLRCVKIIHGRGLRSMKGPRIKDAVLRRLAGRFRRDIIAYVTARQCDGGLGALYILLGKK